MLQALGITELQEALYRSLLRFQGSSIDELATAAQASTRECQKALEVLEQRGLIVRLPGRIRRYSPTPPHLAINGEILRRYEELERIHEGVGGLLQEYRQGSDEASSEHDAVTLDEPGSEDRIRGIDLNGAEVDIGSDVLGAELIPLLASGLTDRAIARQLDISFRTVQRRVHRLMRELGADTRFQAGWLSANIERRKTNHASGR